MDKIKPSKKQIEVLALKTQGYCVVLGTAGSGKTTIAVLRAKFLANRFKDQKILFVTFNKALIAFLIETYETLPKNVHVVNYHKFARGYLNSLGKMKGRMIVESKNKKLLVEKSIEKSQEKYPDNPIFKEPTEVFLDEIKFIESFGIRSIIDYLSIGEVRVASAVIGTEEKKIIFNVYREYQKLRINEGFMYDWDDIAYYVYKELCLDKRPLLYSHVVVDEGQDFSPMMLRSLIKAIPETGSFSFFGDVAQQIYGSRLSWRDAGIEIEENEIWKFAENYRNSLEIANFASDIMKNKYWKASDEDIVIPISPVASGPKPQLLYFEDSDSEEEWIVSSTARLSANSSNVIIVKNREMELKFINALSQQKISVQQIDGKIDKYKNVNGISITTFYSAKGLEFDNVFIPFLNKDNFPDLEKMRFMNYEDVYADELKLLYVAVTRARRGLFMSYSNELTDIFPTNKINYNYTNM